MCQLATYNFYFVGKYIHEGFGEILHRQRVSIPLTLQELSRQAGVSPSHLGRIERGERFPSAHILRKIAQPLHFEEDELFTTAGYLSAPLDGVSERQSDYHAGRLDPYVARVLSQEPVEVQRAVLGILLVLKSLAHTAAKEAESGG